MGELNNIFSNQLRTLCETKSTITRVAEELSINRQQFARYLNGTSIPREPIIERMAAYFSVHPSYFFQYTPEEETPRVESLEALFDLMRTADFHNPSERELEPGFYQILKRSFCTKNVIIRGLGYVYYRNKIAHYKSIRLMPPSFRPRLHKRFYSYSGVFVKIEQNLFLATQSHLNRYISLHCLSRSFATDPQMKSGVHFTLNSEGFLGVRSSIYLLTKIHHSESVLKYAREIDNVSDDEIAEFDMNIINSRSLKNDGVIGS